MSEIRDIALIALILGGCVLVVYMIVVLRRVMNTIAVLQEEIRILRQEIVPGIQTISELAEEIRSTLQSLEPHREYVETTLSNVQRFSGNVLRLQEVVLDHIQPSLEEFASILSSVLKGYRAFISTWKRDS